MPETEQIPLIAPEETSAETPETKPAPDTETQKAPARAYRVLARKYRPMRFEDLIGQDAMVRTLANAFASGRIAHAFMLTGMRGVGKTTTARLIARALNYTGGEGGSLRMDTLGAHCAAIMESRHVDVIEMDAASRTGINDIREIIENIGYRPVMARRKVYIIDEVHMLSTAAFNGLLKTLEEPPGHVVFIFATTQVRKVPVTVLSRCQRFDLRRLSHEETCGLLRKVAGAEKIDIADDACALLAHGAEGAARDALSLLDQAIAHGGEAPVSAADITDMLGLAGRRQILDLFDHLMAGRLADALEALGAHHERGVDPLALLHELAETTHRLTKLKVAPDAQDTDMDEAMRARARKMSARLALSHLTLVWQMLLKGIAETQSAPRPQAAAEMTLVRIAHIAALPAPEDALRRLADAARATPADSPDASDMNMKEATRAPLVRSVLESFPGAEIVSVRPRKTNKTKMTPDGG